MENFFQKFKSIASKRIGHYILGAIGILAIIGIIGSVILASLNSARRKTSFTTSSVNPLSAPSIGIPSFDLGGSGRQKSTSQQSGTAQAQEGQLTQRKIIRNGSLSLLVKKIEETMESVRAFAADIGGFVTETRVYESSPGMKNGTITIRVPAERFDEAMKSMKNLAVRVESENSTSQDVTEQFIDLEARLRNLKAQEEQYLEIMKRAFTIQETLNVQQQLGNVRGQIEQIQGQLQFLSRQIDMSTISISLKSEADVKVFGIYWRPLVVIKQSFYNLLRGLADYADKMIAFIFFLPRLVLWLATITFFAYIAWRIFRWLRPKFSPLRLPIQQNKQNQ